MQIPRFRCKMTLHLIPEPEERASELLGDLTANAAVPAASPVQLFLAVQILEAFEFKAAPATRGGQRHALA
jgi:hypothetical protein